MHFQTQNHINWTIYGKFLSIQNAAKMRKKLENYLSTDII